nr:putative ribonuclease H-like domain-containing protein [Tanacetum cinerariifolium]
EDDSNSDDEPDVLIIHSTPTPMIPIVDEATTQNDGIKSDHATTNVDNLVELIELQALQRQEQSPPMSSCVSPISADQYSISAGKCHVSAGRPTGSAGRPVSAGKPTGSAGRPVSTGRPSGSAARTPVPADIHDGLTIFDCPKSGIFTSSSYDEDFSGPDANNLESSLNVSSTITKRIHNIHPTSQVLGDINSPVQTRKMQQFKNQKVLVTLPDGKRAIGTKWILKNKRDARGIVCRNKARLVAQGHRQEEGIDYTDVFAPVARIKAIRLFLAFASFIGFRVYQMDVKSAFFYEKIAKEVYVTQPRGFEDLYHP